MDNVNKKKETALNHTQNRIFMALGQIATSYDMGASQIIDYVEAVNEWE